VGHLLELTTIQKMSLNVYGSAFVLLCFPLPQIQQPKPVQGGLLVTNFINPAAMNIELTFSAEPTPFELLDVLVQNRREANQSLLSLHFVGKRGTQADRLKMPLLTWFDANRLQQFTQQLANSPRATDCQMDLPDAGLRLTARGKTRRSIRVEALPTATLRFAPVEINGTTASLHDYAKVLYTRLWEAFCRG
jgi:hypothetical protein